MQNETREQLRERLLSDEALRASISLRAYEIYEQRGCEPGCELEDWLQAENEMLSPLIEGEIQNVGESQLAPDEGKAKQAATAEEKPAKKASRLFRRSKLTSEKPNTSH
jgi:hypothetical protein